MPKIEQRMREDIATFLPNAIQSALKSYQSFSEEEAADPKVTKAKNFKDHHDACKVAIAHIELLIKLAKWADIPPPEMDDEVQQAVLQSIIDNAHNHD